MGITKTYCPELSGLNIIPPVLLYKLSQQRTARITATPYKSLIRYKYLGEDWVEIEGDDYTLEGQNIGDTIEIPFYFVEFEATVNGRFPFTASQPVIFNDGETINCRTSGSYPDIDISNITVGIKSSSYYVINVNFIQNSSFNNTGRVQNTDCFYRNIDIRGNVNEPENNQLLSARLSDNVRVGGANLRNFRLVEDTSKPSLICKSTANECTFKIYKCGQLVYEETREDCPEVEKDNCILDYSSQETIDLTIDPFNTLFVASGVIDISDVLNIFNIINSALNGLPFSNSFTDYLRNQLDGNNDECVIIFTFFGLSTINIERQFCSSCNCPPPQITVDCDFNQCPDNTYCEIDCGSYICCYDQQGYVLDTIIK